MSILYQTALKITTVILKKVKLTEKQTKSIKKILKGLLIGFITLLVIDIIAFAICFFGKLGPFKESKTNSYEVREVI